MNKIEIFTADNFELLENSDGMGVVCFEKETKTLYVDRRARIFEAGVHRGNTYTWSDIDQYVKNFKPPIHELRGWKVHRNRNLVQQEGQCVWVEKEKSINAECVIQRFFCKVHSHTRRK